MLRLRCLLHYVFLGFLLVFLSTCGGGGGGGGGKKKKQNLTFVHGFAIPICVSTSTTTFGNKKWSIQPNQLFSIDAANTNFRDQLFLVSKLHGQHSNCNTITIITMMTALHAESSNMDNEIDDIIARRIIVVGDVDGGYYRSCVKNEASRFRKLIGTMSPPANNKRAEIYVEGKRKMVDGFVRWCKRGDVGLSQSIQVDSVIEEFPTGLYDDFYVATGRS